MVLSKTDAETGDTILADDAVFAVSEYNKNTNEYDFVCNLSHSSTLDNDRYGCTDGYYVNKLPVTEKNDGKYRVTEKAAPTGYVTDGRSYDVVISTLLKPTKKPTKLLAMLFLIYMQEKI